MTVQHTDPATAEDRERRLANIRESVARAEASPVPAVALPNYHALRVLLSELETKSVVHECCEEVVELKKDRAHLKDALAEAERERDAAQAELEAAQARLDKAVEARSRIEIQLEDGELSDGYHTHNELYEYRLLYNAHAARGWVAARYPVVKSWRHSDGEECFGGGWFVVSAELPTGQVTNHYKADDWDLFEVPEAETAFAWDGHTPAEAADRLRRALGLGEEGDDGR